ncbi:hypothetical protein Tco_0776226, partial [Tanacetum coccineum]
MITRSQSSIVKPIDRLSLHTSSISPIPKNPSNALKDPNWRNAMYDKYNALVKMAIGYLYQGLQVLIAKVTAIEELKDLTSLSLDELIGNLKVHEMIIKKDSEIVKAKGERRSLALKAKKESSDEESSTSGSEDEEYVMVGKSERKCFRYGDPNNLIGECPKPPKDKNQREFVGGSWSDSGEKDDEKFNNETCLVAQASSE